MRSPYIFTIMSLLLIRCGLQEIDADLVYEPKKICANAFITPDSIISVSVTYSRNILNDGPYSQFLDIPDATVTILEEGTAWPPLVRGPNPFPGWQNFNVNYESQGQSPLLPRAGRKYNLIVSAPGMTTVTATCQIPMPVSIDEVVSDKPQQIGYAAFGSVDGNSIAYTDYAIPLTVTFTDPPEPGNLYKLVIRVTPPVFGLWVSGKPFDVPLITKDERFFNPRNPPAGIAPSVPLYYPVTFNDEGRNGKSISVQAYAPILYPQPAGQEISYEIGLYSLSSEYYKYSMSEDLLSSTKYDQFAQPVIVYSNIENGVGIFAGYSKSFTPLKK